MTNSPHSFEYDLIVLGCGPAGQRGAVQAAKLRKKVAIIDNREVVGGVCVNTGTIPSKSFKEAVMYLSGFRQRNIYGAGYSVKSDIEMCDLTFRCDYIMQQEIGIISSQLKRNHVDLKFGEASFLDPHTVQIESAEQETYTITSDKFLIATGAYPYRPEGLDFSDRAIVDSDDVLTLEFLPRVITVVGGGVIGVEYASMFAALGSDVTIIDTRDTLLTFLDREIVENLKYQLRSHGVTLRLGEEVQSCAPRESDNKIVTKLKSGKVLIADCALISAGRVAATDKLNLKAIGLQAGKRGRLEVNEHLQTKTPNIYAAGDVIGFPGLASTSSDQGRLAICHAFNKKGKSKEVPLPYGIYSIPELSIVGPTEEELTTKGIPYETGVAYYKETARGQLIGDISGYAQVTLPPRHT